MRIRDVLKVLVAIFIVLGITSSVVFPQSGRGTGRQKGVVADSNNKPIQNAIVTMKFLDSSRTLIQHKTKTNKKGQWVISKLGYGRWVVTASYKSWPSVKKTIVVSQVNVNPLSLPK